MTNANIPADTTVYVRWYGKLLLGTVVNDHDLMGMVAVRIPLQGGHPVALYTPEHVYASAEEAQRTGDTIQHQEPAATVPDGCPSGVPPTVSDHPRPLPTVPDSSGAWQTLQQFKQEHWDAERNRLRTDALSDFYRLWRASVAAKQSIIIEASAVLSEIAVGATAPIDTFPIVTEEHHQEPKQKVPVKLTRKQLRSTGRIEYTDSIQTSLFD